jgi:hypothetical protein
MKEDFISSAMFTGMRSGPPPLGGVVESDVSEDMAVFYHKHARPDRTAAPYVERGVRVAIASLAIATLTVTGLAAATVHAHFVRGRPTLAAAVVEPTAEPEPEAAYRRGAVAPAAVFGGVPGETEAPAAADSIGAVPSEACPADPNELADRPDCPTPREIDTDGPREVLAGDRKITVESAILIIY